MIPKRFILHLDVEYNPNGKSDKYLKDRLEQVVTDALNNRTLSGDGTATVVGWSHDIKEVKPHEDGCPCCGL